MTVFITTRNRFALLIWAIPVFVSVLTASQEPKFTNAMIFGFHGPIHTQLSTFRMLADFPAEGHRLSIREPQGWLTFDPSGFVIERGDVDSSGKPSSTVHLTWNAEGTQVVSTTEDGKTWTSPSGATQSVAHKTLEGDQFGGRYVPRYDQEGQLIEAIRYDAEGKIVSDLSLKDGVLTSWWQDPKCNCTNIAGFRFSNESTGFYTTTEQGTLFKTVQHHKGRATNHEIDDEELFDEKGLLLERIAYTYERDGHGNWIKRLTSVLDTRTGGMIPVREDVRTLTYY